MGEEKPPENAEKSASAEAAPAPAPAAEEAKPAEEQKEEEKKKDPEEDPAIVLKVDMHCPGCVREVRRSIRNFKGVEDVKIDRQLNLATVKGKNVDPLRLRDRVQRKCGKKIDILSPIPAPKAAPEDKKPEDKPPPKPEPVVLIVVLNVNMHCEGCAQEVKRKILKLKGVQTAEPDFMTQKVTVKGIMDPKRLADYVYRKTSKRAQIVSVEEEPKPKPPEDEKKDAEAPKPEEQKPPAEATPPPAQEGAAKPPEEKPPEEEKKPESPPPAPAEAEKAEAAAPAPAPTPGPEEAGKAPAETSAAAAAPYAVVEEVKRHECCVRPRYTIEFAPPPQLFSDENPHACSVM